MFKQYQSKPIVRLAYQIQPDDEIFQDYIDSSCGIEVANGESHGDGDRVIFVAHEEVKAGDYIVYLNENDIYHCNAKVFAERNIIE